MSDARTAEPPPRCVSNGHIEPTAMDTNLTDGADQATGAFALEPSAGMSLRRLSCAPGRRFAGDTRAALLVGLFVMDIAVLIGGAVVGNLIWHGTPQLPARYWAQVAIGCAIFFPMMQIAGMYRFAALSHHRRHLSRLTSLWAGLMLTLMAIIYLGRLESEYSRAWILLWALSGWLGLMAARILAWQAIRQLRARDRLVTQAVVIGSGAAAERCAKRLHQDSHGDVRVIGVFEPSRTGFREVAQLRDQHRIDEIVVALPCSELVELASPFAVGPHVVDVKVGLDLAAASAGAGYPPFLVVPVRQRPLAGVPAIVKRIFDICVSVLLLLFALPMMGLIAVLVKLDSPGPVLFKQQRFGLNKRPFELYKFRSMRCEAGADPIVPQARRNDPRVTRVGRFLRRASLDELPQLINVLKGDMSLVGPRPHASRHDEKFAVLIDNYLARHRVMPGITGWAQVHGLRGETDTLEKMEQRVEYDLYYIEHWSLLLDLRILARTLGVVLAQRNAY